MAESLTYSSLINDIVTYAERSDQPFLNQIPRFIMLAEQRIAAEARGLGFLRVVTGTLQPGQATLQKPARWRESASFLLRESSDWRPIYQRGYLYCRQYAPDQTATDKPAYYADYDFEHFLIAPAPAVATDFELAYYELPEQLSEANQANWTTRYAPHLLLYATLLEAQPFLKLSQRIAEFQALYAQALEGVKLDSARRLSGDQSLLRSAAQ